MLPTKINACRPCSRPVPVCLYRHARSDTPLYPGGSPGCPGNPGCPGIPGYVGILAGCFGTASCNHRRRRHLDTPGYSCPYCRNQLGCNRCSLGYVGCSSGLVRTCVPGCTGSGCNHPGGPRMSGSFYSVGAAFLCVQEGISGGGGCCSLGLPPLSGTCPIMTLFTSV